MLHSVLRWLVARGHSARVIVDRRGQPFGYDLNGVSVVEPSVAEYEEADLVITHLDLTHYVLRFAQLTKTPCIHLVHNEWQLGFFNVDEADLVIFNSRWLSEKVQWKHGPSVVCRPPIWRKDYETESTGRYITLVNLTVDKGITHFLGLARRFRDKMFLGVEGSYGTQIAVPAPNIHYVKNGQHSMKEIYGETRLVLMPSKYESFGRIAIEAAHSGIPTIAHPTPGLKEALGRDAMFCDREDSKQWYQAIELMDDGGIYKNFSEAARTRARFWEEIAERELMNLEEHLADL